MASLGLRCTPRKLRFRFQEFLSSYTPLQNIVSSYKLHDCIRRRQWQPTPVLLPGKSHGRRGLVPFGLSSQASSPFRTPTAGSLEGTRRFGELLGVAGMLSGTVSHFRVTETHVHRVSNAIQPSHFLLSPSPPAPNPS